MYFSNSNSGQPTATATPTPPPASSPTPTQSTGPTSLPTSPSTPQPSASSISSPTATPTAVSLNGAGATFPQPFINTIIGYYLGQKPWVQINYQGVGSGAGINSLTAKTVDFAASDAPLSDSQITSAPNVVHIPETCGAVALAYNLPGVSSGLKLTGSIIANIYLGTITNWNDPAIVAINPGTTLPNHAITTVHRSDGSGTTFIFTRYLSAVSSTWSSQVGSNSAVQWPGNNAIGGSGNAGLATTVIQTQYSIGYVELAYAINNGMTYANVQNPAGNFITPTLASTTAAVQSGASSGLPSGDQSWYSVSLVNSPDSQAYPIVGLTYLMEYKELNVISGMTQEKATAIVQFFWFVVHGGQQYSTGLSYATLPANVVQIDEATIRSITFNGQTLSVT